MVDRESVVLGGAGHAVGRPIGTEGKVRQIEAQRGFATLLEAELDNGSVRRYRQRLALSSQISTLGLVRPTKIAVGLQCGETRIDCAFGFQNAEIRIHCGYQEPMCC